MWSVVYTRPAVFMPNLREPALTGCWTILGHAVVFVLEHDKQNSFVTLTCQTEF